MFNKKLLDLFIDSRTGNNDEKKCSLIKQYDERVFYPIQDIVKKSRPSKWGFKFAKLFMKLQKDSTIDFRIKKFIDDFMPLMWDALRAPIKEGSIPRTTIHTISDINKILPARNCNRPELLFTPIEELPRINPKFSYHKKGKIMQLIYKHSSEKVAEIPLMKNVWNKGGDVRVVLKGLFNDEFIKKEIPLNDHDICVRDYNIGKNYMSFVGESDLSGIEIFDDMVNVIISRNVDMNQGLLSSDGIYYTEDAKKSIISGEIRPIGADQGVFGKGTFFVNVKDGHGNNKTVKIFKPRVAYERSIKFVIEEKTGLLILDDNNLQLFMGIYLIVSFCRLVKKQDRSARIEKIYYLLKEMGIVDHYKYVFKKLYNVECDNVFDLFEYTHRLYPFFELEVKGRDDQVAQWLIMKLNKWCRNEFRSINKQYSEEFYDSLMIDPNPNVKRFSLKEFKSNPEMVKKIDSWIPNFLERCKERNVQAGSMLMKK